MVSVGQRGERQCGLASGETSQLAHADGQLMARIFVKIRKMIQEEQQIIRGLTDSEIIKHSKGSRLEDLMFFSTSSDAPCSHGIRDNEHNK